MRPVSRAAAKAARPMLLVTLCLTALADGRAMRLQSGDGPYFDPVGLQADRGYFSELPWEHVDMVNGNLIAKFTDLVLPGNAGMDLRFVRQYNAGGTWQFGLEGIPILTSSSDDPLECCDYPGFVGVGLEENSFPENGVMGSAPVYLTRRFWRYTWATRTLQLPNGWTGLYDGNGRLQELRDPFDNLVTFTYEGAVPQLKSVTQHLGGQTRTVTYTLGPNGPTEMVYDGRTWTYGWTWTPGVGNTLTSVQPPAGPAWGFSYTSQQPGPCYQFFPNTVGVTTPYGGLVQYQFAVRHVEGTVSPPECHAAVASRTLSGPGLETATWTFDVPLTWTQPDWTKTSSVTTPMGRTVIYTHATRHGGAMGAQASAQFLTRKEIVGAALVERTPTILSFVGGITEPGISQQKVTVDGILHQTDFAYDDPNAGPFANYHRPYRTTECQASGGNCVGPARTTTRTFQYGFTPHIIGPVQNEKVLVSGGDEYQTSQQFDLATGFQTRRIVNGIETTYTPTPTGGNVGQEIGAITTSFTYDGGVVKDTIRPMSTTSRVINADGTVASETRGAESTSYIYDDIGRPERMTPSAGERADTVYDDALRKVTVCRGSQCTVTLHDGIGRPVSVTNPAGVTTTTRYDKDGRKVFESYPGGGPNDGDTYSYDALNRVTSVCHPAPDSSCRSMLYGSPLYGANTVAITDENGWHTIQWFEAFGDPFERRLVKLRDAEAHESNCSPLLNYAGDCEWEYSYTTLGALKSVNSPSGGPLRTWNYDSRHLLTSEHQPESGTTNYQYNSDGSLAWKEPGGQFSLNLRHLYDGNHRLRAIDQDPATAHWVDFEYDAADNRTRVRNALVDSRFEYDGANRLTKRTDTIGPRTFVTTYTYDGKDHLTQIDYPSGRRVIYSPNASTGRIENVIGPGGVTYASGVQYHPSGAISGLTFGNGTTETIEFDNRHRPDHVTSGPTSGPAANRLDLTYTYDGVGNVLQIVDPRPDRSSTFFHDKLDRLYSVTGFGARDFEYDALGNRIKKWIAGVPVTYNVDGPTQRLNDITSALGVPETATAFTYDAVGNTTGDGTATYGWTPFNTMTSATINSVTTNYGYDGEGQRKKKDGADGVRYYIHGPGGQLLAEYRETSSGPELVREYIYLGSKLIASSTRVDPPVPTGRVTGVTAAPQAQKYGLQTTITVTGWTTPCSKVQVNFGDGTAAQQYTISSPYQLPLQATHTYAAAGLYNVVATGQTGASGPCVGTISTPVEVTSGNVVTNGDFSQGLNAGGQPVGWGVFSQGGPANWTLDNGIKFYRTGATWQAVVLQYTGLAIPQGAPLEATFTMGNTDTVKKRLLMLIHTDTSDDLAACSFWLDANQTPRAYTMRMHTTKVGGWTNASISFYAADATAPGTTGAYHLNQVTLTYRPALNSAKTDCVDPLVPTEGDGWSFQNLILDPDFIWGGDGWWTYQGQDVQWVNALPDQQRVEVRRQAGAPPPVVRQSWPAWSGVVPARQRVQLTFELRNTRTTRQRVNVTLQDASAPGGGTLAFCTFWLPPNMAEKALYAMTAYAATEWTAPELVVSPQTVGAQGDSGWIQFDTVTLRKTNRAMPGTECWEPGSFTVDGTGFINSEWPSAPAPEPLPAPVSDADALPVLDGEAAPAVNEITFHVESERETSLRLEPESVPARTDPLTVIIGGTSSGTVTSNPGGITCAGATVSCTGWFAEGTPVTLTATPDTGLVFVGWAGACTGTGTCQIPVNGPQSVVAHFASPLQYYHMDVLGSVRMMTDAAGAVVIRHDYFAFGEDTAAMTGDPRRFTGKELDPETALQYFGARYYRNLWGRFTSVDPVISRAARVRPQLWNRYAYALNGPLRFMDPSGLEPEERIMSSIESGSLELGGWIDDYAWNEEYQSTADRIVKVATDYDASKLWAFDTTKDEFGIGNKCNKFVYDVTKEAGAEALTRASDGKMRPPTAAEWANKATKIAGWKVLGKNERPRPGDVAAYKIPGGRLGATGHSGIVVGIRANGVVESIAAHADRVGPVKTQFDPSQTSGVVFRRYVGG